jgi:hypothetical protein
MGDREREGETERNPRLDFHTLVEQSQTRIAARQGNFLGLQAISVEIGHDCCGQDGRAVTRHSEKSEKTHRNRRNDSAKRAPGEHTHPHSPRRPSSIRALRARPPPRRRRGAARARPSMRIAARRPYPLRRASVVRGEIWGVPGWSGWTEVKTAGCPESKNLRAAGVSELRFGGGFQVFALASLPASPSISEQPSRFEDCGFVVARAQTHRFHRHGQPHAAVCPAGVRVHHRRARRC